jgi:hypothetical protein
LGRDTVRSAAILCRDSAFWQFLLESGVILEARELDATNWLKHELGVESRTEIATNAIAKSRFLSIKQEFHLWKATTS